MTKNTHAPREKRGQLQKDGNSNGNNKAVFTGPRHRRVQLPAFFIFRTVQGGGGGSEEWLGGLYAQASPIVGAFCTSSHGHFEMSLIL